MRADSKNRNEGIFLTLIDGNGNKEEHSVKINGGFRVGMYFEFQGKIYFCYASFGGKAKAKRISKLPAKCSPELPEAVLV